MESWTSTLIDWMHLAWQWLADTVLALGYPGIMLLMTIESSFIPFPSEIVMIPAGYQIAQGKMHWLPTVLSGLAGSLFGAWINYSLAARFGRAFFLRWGKYVFLSPKTLDKAERFFRDHGEIATFVCRLLPVIRQFVSLPAGLARMNLARFSFYTGVGAGLWVFILTLIGYIAGENEELIKSSLKSAGNWLVVFCVVLTAVYIWRHKKRGAKPSAPSPREAVAPAAATVMPLDPSYPAAGFLRFTWNTSLDHYDAVRQALPYSPEAAELRLGITAGVDTPADAVAWADRLLLAGEYHDALADISLGANRPPLELCGLLDRLFTETEHWPAFRRILGRMHGLLAADRSKVYAFAPFLEWMWQDHNYEVPDDLAFINAIDDRLGRASDMDDHYDNTAEVDALTDQLLSDLSPFREAENIRTKMPSA